jgi:hypothetical protein
MINSTNMTSVNGTTLMVEFRSEESPPETLILIVVYLWPERLAVFSILERNGSYPAITSGPQPPAQQPDAHRQQTSQYRCDRRGHR